MKSKFYTTTTNGMGGWYAVLLERNKEELGPIQTGIGKYPTQEGAEQEAKIGLEPRR